MGSTQNVRLTDRALGFGGLALAVIAAASTTQRIEVSGNAEVVSAITGIMMVLGVLLLTLRHLRVHRAGRGRGWLVAGWALLGVNLMWSIFQAIDTAAFDEGIRHGLQELATGPPILLILAPLVLCSVAMLREGSDVPSTDTSPEPRITTST